MLSSVTDRIYPGPHIPTAHSDAVSLSFVCIAEGFVYPNEMPIPLFDETTLLNFCQLSYQDLNLVEPQGYLKINLYAAKNLKASDLLGRSDPYVIFSVGTQWTILAVGGPLRKCVCVSQVVRTRCRVPSSGAI